MQILGKFAEGVAIGLFENTSNATITNLGIKDCNINVDINTASYDSYIIGIGGIAGKVY